MHPHAAVRERLQILARYVDAVADAVDGAEVLAVGGGHLRSPRFRRLQAKADLKRWVALDQDPSQEIASCGHRLHRADARVRAGRHRAPARYGSLRPGIFGEVSTTISTTRWP